MITVEDTLTSLSNWRRLWQGRAQLVDGLTKISRSPTRTRRRGRQRTSASDPRHVDGHPRHPRSLADRVHNMRTLRYQKPRNRSRSPRNHGTPAPWPTASGSTGSRSNWKTWRSIPGQRGLQRDRQAYRQEKGARESYTKRSERLSTGDGERGTQVSVEGRRSTFTASTTK